jgi:hypothetical protein
MKQISEQERINLLSEAIAKLTKACGLMDEIEMRIKLDQLKGKDETEMASITN